MATERRESREIFILVWERILLILTNFKGYHHWGHEGARRKTAPRVRLDTSSHCVFVAHLVRVTGTVSL